MSLLKPCNKQYKPNQARQYMFVCLLSSYSLFSLFPQAFGCVRFVTKISARRRRRAVPKHRRKPHLLKNEQHLILPQYLSQVDILVISFQRLLNCDNIATQASKNNQKGHTSTRCQQDKQCDWLLLFFFCQMK